MKKTAWVLFGAWLTWVSTAIVDLKKDMAVLRYEAFGVVSKHEPTLPGHPRPILSFPLFLGLSIPFEKPAPTASDTKEKDNADF